MTMQRVQQHQPETPAVVVAFKRPAPAAAQPEAHWRKSFRQVLFSGTGLFFISCLALLVIGWVLPLHRYITPRSGMGYLLGIVGGSSMLVLLLYPARSRWRWLSFMGSVKAWFHAHMVLGLIGPILILYHSDFSLGATNSNVALFCMLIVSGSGLIGRYLYTHIHYGMTERTRTLTELQSNAERLRNVSLSVSFMPQLLERMLAQEQRLLQRVAVCPVLLRPPFAAFLCWITRLGLNRYVRRALRVAAAQSPVLAQQRPRLLLTARGYIAQRLQATKEVSAFQAYERLFSMWHLLHVPMFYMLLIAAIVHVIAVNIY
jgi:hypothetical protein